MEFIKYWYPSIALLLTIPISVTSHFDPRGQVIAFAIVLVWQIYNKFLKKKNI